MPDARMVVGALLPRPAAHLGRRGLLISILALAACGGGGVRSGSNGRIGGSGLYPNETPYLRQRINFWARHYDVPSSLVQRVILRESSHRPDMRNGPYHGLMQIAPQTARTMGYRGPDRGLLDADTNLRYGVKYLRGAWMVAEGDPDRAVMWYSRGYYYEAKRKGLLKRTGLSG
ncbi:lytic transglycosylase domain-containing protein [Paracoccus marcusii]|uniref:lytic transglycosylase domain-containing protein n=1 Tax=Paracoccus marcusii TaxID=59779 RepID=UPI0024913434|nr:lytic transglycosylase domain-containing protein [Paracoccus marcusii]